ncbi:hypothetical protein [Kitasatospora purpeofusca]|uniref:Secreted protein n=1 Tax=Kitasatospora purpeofusca TaxID=67352 RepID=A0ABZ1U8F5_9ACTN|nr:hypothetical protein [Kitasatospora purpeofusca]
MVDGIRDESESGEQGAATVARRSILRAVGLGAASVGLGAALPASAVATGGPATRGADALNSVNLYCSADAGTYLGGGTATVQVTIGNFSSVAATGPVSLKVITPFYANVAALPSVSGGTSRWLYRNSAPDVPSVIQVSFNGFPANTALVVPVTFTLLPAAPNIPPIGRAIFTTDANNTTDTDSDLTRNVWEFGFVRSSLATPPPGNANLYFTSPQLPLIAGGDPAEIPFHFFNGAGNLLHGTQHPAHFTFSTPFYTQIPTAGRPPGLTALYENTDPAIPSVYQLSVPPGLGALGPQTPATIAIPYLMQSNGPREYTVSSAMITPTGSDTQGDNSIAHHHFGMVSVINTRV